MMRITRGVIYLRAAMACCAIAALLAGCSFNSGPAGMPKSTPAGVYVATATTWSSQHPGATYMTVSALAPDTGTVRWRHREEWSPYHSYAGQPVVAQGVVYMVGDINTTSTDPAHKLSGALIALRASDGQQLWRVEVGAQASQPVVDGDVIYISAELVGGKSGYTKEVYALNRGDGSVRWKTEIANTGTVSDALALSQGCLFLGASQICFDSCNAAYLFALDTQSGHILWKQSYEGNVTMQPPVVDGDLLYAQTSGYGGGLHVLSAADGSQLWQHSGGVYQMSAGMVYTMKTLSAPDPNRSDQWKFAVVALDGKTGKQIWQTPTNIYPMTLAVVGGRVIVRSELMNPQASQNASHYLDVIQSLDASDGKQLWSAQEQAYNSTVVANASTLYLALPATQTGGQNDLAALNAANGDVLWRQTIEVASSPPEALYHYGVIAATSDLVCALSDSLLFGARATDGHTLWSANLSASGQIRGVTVVA